MIFHLFLEKIKNLFIFATHITKITIYLLLLAVRLKVLLCFVRLRSESLNIPSHV